MKNTDFLNLELPEREDKINVEVLTSDFKIIEDIIKQHAVVETMELDGVGAITGAIGPYIRLQNISEQQVTVDIGNETIVLESGENKIIRETAQNIGVITSGNVHITYFTNAKTYTDRNFYDKKKVDELLSKVEATVEVDAELSEISMNPVQNKIVTQELKKAINTNYKMMCFNNRTNIKSIAHRGYSTVAAENTISAYKAARLSGFDYVETDVRFTSDDVPVLLHDSTIDRTSNGTGRISSLTYDYVRTLDFGGERIPSFEEFIKFCKYTGLHPYIEFKNDGTYSNEQIESLYNLVKKYGMLKNSTWISFTSSYLEVIKSLDDSVRIGFLMSETSAEYTSNTYLATLQSLKTDNNEVFLDVLYSIVSDSMLNTCMENGFEMEVWTVDTESDILALNPYITGVTSNALHANSVMCDYYLVTETHDDAVIDLDFANYDGNGTISNIGVFENCDAVVTGTTTQSNGAVTFATTAKAIITSDYINQILQSAEYTIVIAVDSYTLSGKTYERIFRCDTDVPSLYYHKNNGGFSFKISSVTPTGDGLSYYNPDIVTLNGTSYCSLNNITNNTMFVFTKDSVGRHIYVNGALAVSQSLSGATVSTAKDIGIGDTNNAGYNLGSLTVSMFKMYDRALSQAKIINLINEEGGE